MYAIFEVFQFYFILRRQYYAWWVACNKCIMYCKRINDFSSLGQLHGIGSVFTLYFLLDVVSEGVLSGFYISSVSCKSAFRSCLSYVCMQFFFPEVQYNFNVDGCRLTWMIAVFQPNLAFDWIKTWRPIKCLQQLMIVLVLNLLWDPISTTGWPRLLSSQAHSLL